MMGRQCIIIHGAISARDKYLLWFLLNHASGCSQTDGPGVRGGPCPSVLTTVVTVFLELEGGGAGKSRPWAGVCAHLCSGHSLSRLVPCAQGPGSLLGSGVHGPASPAPR